MTIFSWIRSLLFEVLVSIAVFAALLFFGFGFQRFFSASYLQGSLVTDESMLESVLLGDWDLYFLDSSESFMVLTYESDGLGFADDGRDFYWESKDGIVYLFFYDTQGNLEADPFYSMTFDPVAGIHTMNLYSTGSTVFEVYKYGKQDSSINLIELSGANKTAGLDLAGYNTHWVDFYR